MNIKIKFVEPSAISPLRVQDTLVFYLKDGYEKYFLSAPLDIPVDAALRKTAITIMP